MKKLLLIPVMLMCISINAQYYKNSIQVTTRPESLGIGLKYSRYFNKVGLYGSYCTGKFLHNEDNYIEHDYKSAIGILIFVKDPTMESYMYPNISCGLVHHNYINRHFGTPWLIRQSVFNEWSFEIGIGVHIHRFGYNLNFDLPNREISIDLGYNF